MGFISKTCLLKDGAPVGIILEVPGFNEDDASLQSIDTLLQQGLDLFFPDIVSEERSRIDDGPPGEETLQGSPVTLDITLHPSHNDPVSHHFVPERLEGTGIFQECVTNIRLEQVYHLSRLTYRHLRFFGQFGRWSGRPAG